MPGNKAGQARWQAGDIRKGNLEDYWLIKIVLNSMLWSVQDAVAGF